MAKRSGKGGKETPAKSGGDTPAGNDEQRAAARVALLRNKLTDAMGDPLMRDQIVRAIRAMMTEKKS